MTTLTPHPILPGTAIPFPCWLWINHHALRDGFWVYYQQTIPVALPCTHYMLTPAGADPATFPRPGEEVPASAEAQDWADMAAKEMLALNYPKGRAVDNIAAIIREHAPKPTPSAQEAAMAAAVELFPGHDGSSVSDGYYLDKAANVILKHCSPSTPTRSQQPPLSPGSGEWSTPTNPGTAHAEVRELVNGIRQAASLDAAESVGRAFLERVIIKTRSVCAQSPGSGEELRERPCFPMELRNLFAVAHNVVIRWNDPHRHAGLSEKMADLDRAVKAMKPLVEAHFGDRADRDHIALAQPATPPLPSGEALFEAADRLHDHMLDLKNWPMTDIPDSVYKPFVDALRNYSKAPPLPSGEAFKPWRCEKCGKFHDRLFPEDGCNWCKGSEIAARMKNESPASLPSGPYCVDMSLMIERCHSLACGVVAGNTNPEHLWSEAASLIGTLEMHGPAYAGANGLNWGRPKAETIPWNRPLTSGEGLRTEFANPDELVTHMINAFHAKSGDAASFVGMRAALEVVETELKLWYWTCRERDETIAALRAKLAPPLPSIGDGKDGLEEKLLQHFAAHHEDEYLATLATLEAAMQADAGREET